MFRLSKADFRLMRTDSRIIEADGDRPKVLRLADGDYLKLFHRRRLISSAIFYPYSRRFCRNVKRVRALGIPSVTIQTLFRIPHLKCTAVRYAPLAGSTLRELGAGMGDPLAERYGRFLADLHHRGIYFPAVHPGNTVLTEDDRFGLIDVGYLRVFPRPLTERRRRRNLRQIVRSQLDAGILARYGHAIIRGYAAVAGHCPEMALAPVVLPMTATVEKPAGIRAA